MSDSDYFGELELLENKPREFSAVVVSATVTLITISREVNQEYLVLSLQKFITFVRDTKSLSLFKSHIQVKQDLHDKLLQKSQKIHHGVLKVPESKPQQDISTYNKPKNPLFLSLQDLDNSKSNTQTLILPPLKVDHTVANLLKTQTMKQFNSSIKPSTVKSPAKTLKDLETQRIIPKNRRRLKQNLYWRVEMIQNEVKQLNTDIKNTESERVDSLENESYVDEEEVFNFVRGSLTPKFNLESDKSRPDTLSIGQRSKTENIASPKRTQFCLTETSENTTSPITPKRFPQSSRVIKALGLDRLLVKTPIDKLLTNRANENSSLSSIQLEIDAIRKIRKSNTQKERLMDISQEENSMPSIEIRSGGTPNTLYDRLKSIMIKSEQ